jgi:uridine kinase
MIEKIHDLSAELIQNKTNKPNQPFVIGISGIDASGKGYISKLLQADLISYGYSCHLENLDGYLNLPEIRFSTNSKCR